MNKRIRYQTVEGTSLLSSTRTYQVGDNTYQVVINTAESSFTIQDLKNLKSAETGTASTLIQLKLKAKQALESLGVCFDGETRKTKTSVESSARV